MRRATAELIVKDPNKFAHHDRVFLNNPVVMQGMGLAPLVVLATSGQNAVMLAVAVALLLVPSRMLACLLQCPGVADYSTFTVDGGTAAITLKAEDAAVVGTITVTA